MFQELKTRYTEATFSHLLVVDFNPESHVQLKKLGVPCKYGDIGHIDTLRTLCLEKAQILICTIPDHLLKGTTNLRILRQLRNCAPDAKIVVTAETIESAREMYRQGADNVFTPRLVSAHFLADVVERLQTNRGEEIRKNAITFLESRHEIVP